MSRCLLILVNSHGYCARSNINWGRVLILTALSRDNLLIDNLLVSFVKEQGAKSLVKDNGSSARILLVASEQKPALGGSNDLSRITQLLTLDH